MVYFLSDPSPVADADEDRVSNNLLQISKLWFGKKAKLLFILWAQGLVKILKLKFRQDFCGEKIFCVGKKLAQLQLQILPELQLQNLDQTLCSKS